MRTDPLAFEALRHRITTIADEGSAVLAMVSSSPVAAEANDCNVAIMDRDGSAIAIGPGLSGHGIGCMMTARYVLAEYQANPGIRDGDMFIANDPYTCSQHQTCVTLVMPVFWQGQLAAWVGAGIHVPDAGGPVHGQVGVGATSIFQEAAPMPPMRIVEAGVVRNDIESEFVIRSRTPRQLALDLRALIAACRRLTARLQELYEASSVGTIDAIFADMIDFNSAHLVERIGRLPDGEWQTSVWLDLPLETGVELYECRLRLTKQGKSLTADLSESSPQAGAVINAGLPGLYAGVVNALMVLLGYGLPLCPEAVFRTVEIRSRPGTFVHAIPPAGCSKATTAACHAILMAFNLGLSEMYAESEEFHDRVLAASGGYCPVIELEGTDQRGERFGAPLLDIALSAGHGAMADKDGIDSAGLLHSPFAAISNVETYEARYPILYLWRRHEIDSGGLGRYRGGQGVGMAWTPHRARSPLGIVLHGHGCEVASTPGVKGGNPGATNTFAIARAAQPLSQMHMGGIPQHEQDFRVEANPSSGLHVTTIGQGDVVIARNNGGGGYGDPLTREPSLVLNDLLGGAISEAWAYQGYGVSFRDGAVDEVATRRLREELSRQRLLGSGTVATVDGASGLDDERHACSGCESSLSLGTAFVNHRELRELGERVLPSATDDRFVADESVCPQCGTRFDLRLRLAGQAEITTTSA